MRTPLRAVLALAVCMLGAGCASLGSAKLGAARTPCAGHTVMYCEQRGPSPENRECGCQSTGLLELRLERLVRY
jgi:hypothetical protein